jgi:polyisoprenyl-phosphate glycosyltransferase
MLVTLNSNLIFLWVNSNMSKQKQKISLIIPCFNEEENIKYAYEEIIKYLNSTDLIDLYDFEIIYIDDGSIDNTLEELKKLENTHGEKVKIIELSKNFGKEVAITAGLHICDADAAIIFDADMQYPIEKLKEFISKWEDGNEIVIGIRNKKNTKNAIEILGSKLFYMIMAKISSTEIISGALDYRLLDRQVIDEFSKFTERGRISRVLIDWMGFRKSYIYYDEKERSYGTASFNFSKRVTLAINSIINHSFFPMTFVGIIGLFTLITSVPVGIILAIAKIFGDPFKWKISGMIYLGIFNAFLTGIILISLYIANIQREVINRPLYIIKKQK